MAKSELDLIRKDMILQKRKIELRERFYNEKEAKMVEWEKRLGDAEGELIR